MAFSSTVSAPQKLTKISSVNNSNISNPFLQFAFKFLIYTDRSEEAFILNDALTSEGHNGMLASQERTIQLFNIYLKDLVAFAKNSNESSLLNAVILALTWCLTSEVKSIRADALDLMEKSHKMIGEHL